MQRIAACAAIVCGLTIAAAFAAEPKLDGVKCIVATSKDAKADKSRDYKEGKVYFCCDNCPKKFDADKKKYAAKANAQLVATEQYKQAKCPISGQDYVDDQSSTVGGAKVYFCCEKCKGKVDKAKGDDQLDLAFGDKAFEKGGFKKVDKK